MTKIKLPKNKNLRDNIFAKYFFLFSAIMLIVLTILGTTLTALVGAYTQKQATDLLMENDLQCTYTVDVCCLHVQFTL